MYKTFKLAVLSLVIIFTVNVRSGFTQDNKKKPRSIRETERKLMHSRDSLLRTLSTGDTSVTALFQSVQQYATTFNQISASLADGLDTLDAGQQMPRVEKRVARVESLANTHKSSTLRYLFVLRDNLDHLQDQLEGWQSDIDNVSTKLFQNQRELVRFARDSLLESVPEDPILREKFLNQISAVRNVWRKADSANRSDLLKVNLLQDRMAVAYTKVLDETDQIDAKIKRFAGRAVTGEYGFIWDIEPQYNNLKPALDGTLKLNQIQLSYFGKNEMATHLVGLLFLIVAIGWIIYNRQRSIRYNDHPETILDHSNYIYKKPVVSALLVSAVIIPCFYDHPPTGVLEAFFLLSIILVLILIKNEYNKSLFNFLQKLFWLAVVYSISNLFIQLTNSDRFVILILSIISIAIAYKFIKTVKQAPADYLPYTHLALIIFICLQVVSLLLNITGRFSLAKIIGITAINNLWLSVTLYFVIQIITQGFYLQFQTKKDDKSILGWIDYNLMQNKIRNVLSTLAILLWTFFLLQNLNIDDFISDYVSDILSQSRSVAGATFTFGGFVIFIAVIWLSSILSRIVSYFYDVSAQRASDITALQKKNRTSTLLIRIAVFSAGFLLAVAASGFPLEKLTIIISAFGIGIGFGLQNIVNNLVSGVILAFEKPIQIGDTIEVDGRSGTMQEIGIRSSKLLTGEGSEVIIPNGDLISHHVVNWTLSNSNRRIELIIGTAYGTDIEKAKSLLTDMLNNREDIMTSPGPSVFLHNLSESTVDFRVFFWAADLNHTLELKSRILADIYHVFNREGIEIPYPQSDVHVYFPDGKPEEDKQKDKEGEDEKPLDAAASKNPPGQAP